MKKHLRKKVRERDYDKRKSLNANRKSKHPHMPRESLKQIQRERSWVEPLQTSRISKSNVSRKKAFEGVALSNNVTTEVWLVLNLQL